MAQRLAILGLLAAFAFTQAGGCLDDDDDDPSSGITPGPVCSNAKSSVTPPAPGGSGPTIIYTCNNHSLTWRTSDATTLSNEDQILTLVNNYRASLSPPAPALVMVPAMREVARGHSRHLRTDEHGFMNASYPNAPHTNPEGDSFSARLTANGVSWSASAENIAAGYVTPINAFNGWLGSPGHKTNIERSNMTRTGVGFQPGASGDIYSDYWTQVFAN